jgi:DNA-binding transcriptional LysR family regulator
VELRHLRYAVAVAELLHFGRAAERLHISQPPLSLQIRQLEQELGVALFHRTKRQVRVTEAGRLFVDEARQILAQADHAGKLAQRVSHGEIGQLTIGVLGAADADIIIRILRVFARRHPKVRIVLRNMGTAQQVQALKDGRIQIGFLASPVNDDAVTTETVMRYPIMIALPPRHALASRTSVPVRALAGESHIMFSRDVSPAFFDSIIAACRSAGVVLNIVHEADSLYSACTLVAAGLGVCFVPGGVQEVRRRPIVLRSLKPGLPHLDAHLAVAYKRDAPSELVRLFLAAIREVRSVKRRGRRHADQRVHTHTEPVAKTFG